MVEFSYVTEKPGRCCPNPLQKCLVQVRSPLLALLRNELPLRLQLQQGSIWKFGPSHIQTILSPQSRPCRQCPDLLTILTGPNHGPGLCRPVHLKLRTQAAYMKAMVYIVRSFGNTIHNYCPTPCVPCLNVVPSPLKVSSSILNEPQPWNRGKIFRFPWYTALSYAAADWLKFENWRYLRPGIGSAISRVQKGTR